MVNGTVTVNRGTTTGTIGAGYLGFSFEKTHLTNSSLTGTNAPLIALFKLIGPPVIRIGANDVELCSWSPGQAPAGGGPPYGKQIGTGMVDELNDFLTATGARVIYGLNFSLNNPANDAAEATYAQSKLGTNLYGFEIGNELDKYGTWASQRPQYESLATSVVNAVPDVRLIGPASGAGSAALSLATPYAQNESAKFPNKILLLTQHYYVGGSGSTNATVTSLQTVKSDIPSIATTMNSAAVNNHIPDGYRFGEANSFYNHGQMGLSDTLLAGLWSIDLMFVIAQHGASGINFHGGETGMDGTRPFYYEPIMEHDGVVQETMPVYHGMLFFYLAGQGHVLATTVSSSNPNFTAYALDYQADGSTSVVLNNKNASTGVQVTVNVGTAVTSASAIYLQAGPAGSLTAAASSVTLAGAHVNPQGTWARNPALHSVDVGQYGFRIRPARERRARSCTVGLSKPTVSGLTARSGDRYGVGLMGRKRLAVVWFGIISMTATSAGAAERKDVPERYKWNLADLYPSEAAWAKAKDELTQRLPDLAKYRGHLGKSPKEMLAALQAMFDLDRDLSRLAVYANSLSDEDIRAARPREMKQAAEELATAFSSACSWVRPEILTALNPAKVRKFVAQESKLAPYRVYLEETLRRRPHTLGAGEERVAAEAGELEQAGGEVHGVLSNADLPYPTIKLSTGESVRLDPAAFHGPTGAPQPRRSRQGVRRLLRRAQERMSAPWAPRWRLQ